MHTLTVNGQQVSCPDNKKLLHFLREDLRLTSAKDGCSEGACGTCMVLVDGKATRACIPTLEKLVGKSVLTVEGLSPWEKEVFAFAFTEAGAVQCGFCIPGMVMSSKALLDTNLSPNRKEIKKALRGNICRCTGYAKIEDAVLIAAQLLRENLPLPHKKFTGILGEDFHRVDAKEKILGTGAFANDLELPDMVYASAVRTLYPRAKVVKIDTTKAKAHPMCETVLTAKDVPGKLKIGHLVPDWDVMIAEGDITRYLGDAVALVVSKSENALGEIKALVEITYEELKPVSSPKEALLADAPLLHEKGNILRHELLKRGDADAAIAKSAHVVTRHYSLPFTEHACMEPECAVAAPEGDTGIRLFTGSQGIYDEQREVSMMLGVEPEKVHVTSMLVGGGFGGKEDMSVQHHAALAAWHVKKPVKVRLTRQESIIIHPKRHAMELEFTTACDENGNLTGMKATIISDTGAYASLGGPVLQRACTHAAGPYNYQNMEVEGIAVYTNNPPAGAFRGFGVTQSAFATENNLNLLAEMVGISPWEIRYRNAIRPGQTLPNGQIVESDTDLLACLEAVKDVYEKNPYAGIACSFKNSGLGVGVPDIGRCILSVEKNKLHIRTSAACIGQGMATVLTQMVCETLQIDPTLIWVERPDTLRTPNSGTTTASRQTVLTGEATIRAAKLVKKELDAGKKLTDLEGKEFYGEYCAETDPMGSDKPNPISHIAYGYAAQVVVLNSEGRVEKVVAAYDVGRVVNPKSAEGQIEGGVAMGLGYALTENYPLDNCKPLAKYGTLGLLRAPDVPSIEAILVKTTGYGKFAYGAKGVGELATIPTAPAVSGAYYKLDGVFSNKIATSKYILQQEKEKFMKLLIKNAQIATSDAVTLGDVLIEKGKISRIDSDISQNKAKIIDAAGKYLLPGGIDAHTHFDLDTGAARTSDDFFTGSVAAACGGTTTIIDHLGFGPQGCQLEHQVNVYHELAKNTVIDYGFHGVIQHVDQRVLTDMERLIEKGITSYKFYLTYGFQLHDSDIMRVLEQAQKLGIIMCVHCEHDTSIQFLTKRLLDEGKKSPIFHAKSRPVECEAKAIWDILMMAAELKNAPVYIVHLSSALGLDVIRLARNQGQANIFAETCPQYLFFDESKYDDTTEGLKFIMSPPLRTKKDNTQLWQGLKKHDIDVVATDHCPFLFTTQK